MDKINFNPEYFLNKYFGFYEVKYLRPFQREQIYQAMEEFADSDRKRIWKKACESQMEEVYKQLGPDVKTKLNSINHWTKMSEYKSD